MPDAEDANVALVLGVFRDVLGLDLGSNDDFFASGGDSVASEAVLLRLEEVTGLSLPGWTLLDHPTARSVAAFISREAQGTR